jgi:hypothetical protein
VVRGIDRVVDRAVAVGAVIRDGADIPGAGLDQDLGGHVAPRVIGGWRGRQHVVHGVIRGALVMRVQGRVDRQAALALQLGPGLLEG